MRCFIALPVSDVVKQEVELVQAELRAKYPRANVTWSEPRDTHLTLLFLGELDSEQVAATIKVLKNSVFYLKPEMFTLSKIFAFPHLQDPKILIIEAESTSQPSRVDHWRTVLCRSLKTLNILFNENSLRPHLTLGRIKQGVGALFKDVGQMELSPLTWTNDRVELIQSELTAAGPHYTTLESFFIIP